MRVSTGRLWRFFLTLSFMWLVSSILFFFGGYRSESDGWRLNIRRLMAHRLRIPPGDNCTVSTSFKNPYFVAEKQLRDWIKSEFHHCSHNLFVVPAGLAKLYNVTIDPNRASGRVGGEDIKQVMNQAERQEYWTLSPGTFRVLCPGKPSSTKLGSFVGPFHNARSYLNTQYIPATDTISDTDLERLRKSNYFAPHQQLRSAPVLAMTRYEYANLYHSTTNFYNAFVGAIFYGIDPNNVTILLIDGHPNGAMDEAWRTLFPSTIRIGQLMGPQLVDELVWVMMGYDSPMFANRPDLPMHESFRNFVLAKHGIWDLEPAGRSRNCSGSRVVLVWRRDYVAHPRNPKGLVARKIANEAQVLADVRRAYPRLSLNVTGVALETLTFREQLSLVAGARVLIGMHGAGLTHAMFLPKWSGLVELFPKYGKQNNVHFRSMAKWRGLAYERWGNGNQRLELPGLRTHIPNGLVGKLLGSVLRQLKCTTR